MIRKLLNFLVYGPSTKDVPIIDHVPVPRAEDDLVADERRAAAIRRARERHGQAFKCAGLDQDREVILAPRADARIVRAGYVAPKKFADRGIVETLRLRRSG